MSENIMVSDDKLTQLMDAIEENKGPKGSLIQVLHEAQEIYGYLPLKVQKVISQEMNIPLAEIYGVITFYTQFTLKPKGTYNISVCLGTACYVKGSNLVLERIKEKLGIEEGESTADGKISLESCRCLGACGLAPVMTVNDNVYGRLKASDVDDIIDLYLKK